MRVAVVVVGDGRPQYLSQAVASLEQHFPESLLEAMILINDAADENYSDHLRQEYPQFDRQIHHETRRGLAGAVRSAWETALEYPIDYVFHAEEDFTYTTDIPVGQMAYLLQEYSNLAQVVLMRNPVPHEKAAGGVIQASLSDHIERHDGNLLWVEHTKLFSFNPCLIPTRVIESAVELAPNFLEHDVTDLLLDLGYKFSYWGGMTSEPLCHHIGDQRSSGYHW